MKLLKPIFWKHLGIILTLVILIIFAQFLYFSRVYSEEVAQPPKNYDLVLMYGGSFNIRNVVELTQRAVTPLYVSGESRDYVSEAKSILGSLQVIDDPRARTTDQNARYSADYIRRNGNHRILLLTKWDQLPRALFLTNFYLLGSGATVIPCANSPAPKDWWHYRQAWVQFFKLWGSLGRVILHWVGIDNWPSPQWMP